MSSSDAGSRRLDRSSSGSKTRATQSVARDSANLGLPKIDALFVLGILRKHWKWMLPIALLLGGVSSAAVLAFFKPTYEAKYRLEIDPSSYIVFSDVRATPS
ncbi:MAG: hypothetical protein ACKOAH_20710, partial [Pirellula sp.]